MINTMSFFLPPIPFFSRSLPDPVSPSCAHNTVCLDLLLVPVPVCIFASRFVMMIETVLGQPFGCRSLLHLFKEDSRPPCLLLLIIFFFFYFSFLNHKLGYQSANKENHHSPFCAFHLSFYPPVNHHPSYYHYTSLTPFLVNI